MTKLSERKTRLTFETEAVARYRGKQRNVVVEPGDDGHLVALWLKGTKVRYEISWEAVFDCAAKLYANAELHQRRVMKAIKSERANLYFVNQGGKSSGKGMGGKRRSGVLPS
jgi:hypothetical protein